MLKVEQYISINKKRLDENNKPYNPLTGDGCDECLRVKMLLSDAPTPVIYIPKEMLSVPLVSELFQCKSIQQYLTKNNLLCSLHAIEEVWKTFTKIRIKYDFPFWAFMFCVIKKKGSEKDMSFKLNRGQRKLLRVMFDMWQRDVPIRIILLKARQWGGSTLIQVFMIWIQLVHLRQWNSVIVSHIENTAKTIRGMYTKILDNYDPWLLDLNKEDVLKLTPFENSQKTKQLKERACKITIGSAEKPEGIRGGDESMAHLSEVSLFPATKGKKPEDLIQACTSGIAEIPKTLIAYESTAKGVGNFFHREWLRAKSGKSNFTPVFVSWFEIDTYAKPISSYELFIDSMTEKEHRLFNMGATLEAIAWYRNKLKTSSDEWRVLTEFPSDDIEAFQSTGNRYFDQYHVQRLRSRCSEPIFEGDITAKELRGKGAMQDIRFVEDKKNSLKVWVMPDVSEKVRDRYVVVIDVGKGKSDAADNSDVVVFDRYWQKDGGVPEVAAEWSGHIDMDLLAWKGVQLAKMYGNALLVIESNTLETNKVKGEYTEFILDEIAEHYDNLFSRTPSDKILSGLPIRWGFHTNESSKKMVIAELKANIRDDPYYENNPEACDEMDTYETKENGSLGAVEGCRDDKVITRAIGIWVCYKHLDAPRIIDVEKERASYKKKTVNEATI